MQHKMRKMIARLIFINFYMKQKMDRKDYNFLVLFIRNMNI